LPGSDGRWPTPGGNLRQIQDLLALGDSIWDLGFLVGTDAGLSEKETAGVLHAYSHPRAVDEDISRWHMECWKTLRGLMKLSQN